MSCSPEGLGERTSTGRMGRDRLGSCTHRLIGKRGARGGTRGVGKGEEKVGYAGRGESKMTTGGLGGR